jgi:hypothetical protein
MVGAAPGSRYQMSETGWSNASCFKDYLENHLLKYARHGSDDNQPIFLILDGHTTHTTPTMVKWAQTKGVHLFILPAHSSHILQPLDVAVFGPFKKFYFSECASYMKQNMGKVVTRYEIAQLASRAYLKAMTPWNIVSGFRKTGIFPLNKHAIEAEKLLTCEVFRDQTPLQKAKAVIAGGQAVTEYLERKQLATSLAPSLTQVCQATHNKKPNPSGKEITTNQFIQDIEMYEADKENRLANSQAKKRSDPKPYSPKPSTSGLVRITDTDTDDDDSFIDDTDLCCECGRMSPPDLHKKPYLKIVTWGQCDKCSHWVHLSFCHHKSVIRRGEEFFCKHCV